MNPGTRIAIVLLVMLVVMASLYAFAGDLNPPAGPVGPTMKTLVEIEPRIIINAVNTPGDANSLYRIDQPGSYYLSGNITGVAGLHGIEIASEGVTLDLNGFHLLGVAGSLNGINIQANSVTNVTVRNGSVRGWGGIGVALRDQSGLLYTLNSTISNITASGNVLDGIRCGFSTVITGCAVSFNDGAGISALSQCNISNCIAYSNATGGIFAGSDAVVAHCAANWNGTIGILMSTGTIVECTANENGSDGIVVGAGSNIVRCTAQGNTVNGIEGDLGCTISQCTASENGDNGILADAGSAVTDCTVRINTGDGIEVSGDCRVTGNTCDNNGLDVGDGAGIHTTSTDNHIEGNTVTDNDRGIEADSTGSLVIRNTASGNAINFDIAASNKVGVIVAAPNSGLISGSSGGTGVGTTDGWANIAY